MKLIYTSHALQCTCGIKVEKYCSRIFAGLILSLCDTRYFHGFMHEHELFPYGLLNHMSLLD